MGIDNPVSVNLTVPEANTGIAGAIRRRQEADSASTLSGIALSPLLIPAGAIDTVGQSVGLFDEDTVGDALDNINETLGDTYDRNGSLYRGIGDIATMFGGVGVSAKLLRTGSYLHRGLQASGSAGQFASRVIASDPNKVEALRRLYGNKASVIGRDVQDFAASPYLRKIDRSARFRQLTNDLKEGVAAEAFIVGFQNESELFFSDDQTWKDTATMAALGLGIGGGIGQAIVNAGLKRTAARAGVASAVAGARFSGFDGPDIVAAGFEQQLVRNGPQSNLVSEDPELLGRFGQRGVIAGNAAKRAVENLGNRVLIDDLSKAVDTERKVTGVQQLARKQPKLVANAQSIEDGNLFFGYDKRVQGMEQAKLKQIKELDAKISTAQGGEVFDLQLRKNKLQEEITLLNDVYPVYVNKFGNAHADANASQTIADVNYSVNRKQDKNKPTSFTADPAGARTSIGINTRGEIVRGGKSIRTSASLSVADNTRVYAAMPSAVRSMINTLRNPKTQIAVKTKVRPTDSHEKLDYILHALDNGADMSLLNRQFDFEGGLIDKKSIKLAAIKQKYKRFAKVRKLSNADQSLVDVAHGTNLNVLDDMGEANVTADWLDDVLHNGGRTAFDSYTSYDAVLADFARYTAIHSTPETIAKAVADGGDLERFDELLNMNMAAKIDEKRDSMTLLVQKPADEIEGTIDLAAHKDVALAAADARAVANFNMYTRDADINPFLAEQAMLLKDNGHLRKAIEEGAVTANTASASQPVLKKAGFLSPATQSFKTRFVPGADAAASLSDIKTRAMRQSYYRWVDENLSAVREMQLPQNRMSRQLYNDYHSGMQHGWKLADDGVPDNGVFRLSDEPQHKAINDNIARDYGLTETPEFMPRPRGYGDMSGSPLQLDDVAVRSLQGMRRLDDMIYSGNQMLARSMGRSIPAYVRGHTIVPSRLGKEMVFVADRNGVVDYATGRSVEDAKAAAQRRLAGNSNSQQLRIVSKDDVEEYKMLMDDAFYHGQLDISDSFSQTGSRQPEGKRQGLITDDKFVDAQLQEAERLLLSQANRHTASEFRDTIEHMYFMKRVSAQPTNDGIQGNKSYEDVYDLFTSQLTNKTTQNRGSLYGYVDAMIEDAGNAVMNKLFEAADGLNLGANARSNRAQVVSQRLASEYGYDPVATADALLRNSVGATNALDIRGAVRGAAAATQFMALKMFEAGHALLTSASIMTTTPHTIAGMRRLQNESEEQFSQRLGYMADLLPNGMAMPNEGKLMINVMNRWFRGDYNNVLKEARELGYTDALMGEVMQHMGAPSNKGYEWAEKLVTLGGISQRSETMAREIAFLASYDVLRNVNRNGHNIAMSAANDMANRVIADYRPQQRAELFRGVAGIPLGLFQTFAINYFQKMYQGIENKELRAQAIRFGTQAFMFGGASVAGYDFFNETMFSNWDGNFTPERLFESADPGVADLFLYGTLSNLPKLLGFEDGLAVNTRGEMQTPRVIPTTLSETPVAQFSGRVLAGIGAGMSALMQDQSLGFDQAQEALVQAIPNRPLRGMTEVLQGYSTNRNGDLIEEDTRSLLSVVGRVAGLKPLREAKKGKALWLDRQTEMLQRTKKQRLRNSLVARLRDNPSMGGEELSEYLERYVAYGGSQRGLRRFVKESALKAMVSKFDRRMMEKLRSTKRGNEVLRFIDVADDEGLGG